MRYDMQLQTTTDTKSAGAIQDPQGPSQLVIRWDATLRLEVLGPAEAAPAASPSNTSKAPPPKKSGSMLLVAAPVRIRTTYEKSVATVTSDTPEPQAEDIANQYANLRGRSIEFTLASDGRVSDVHGLEGIVDGEKAIQAAQQWIAQLSSLAQAPQAVTLGQSWSSVQPADSVPLAGVVWRTDSSYVRNEPCRTGDPAAAPVNQLDQPVAAAAEKSAATAADEKDLCAVILTRQAVVPQRQLRDPTPEEYRRNGLRTSGRWSGSGENLTLVSLQTGWAVSVAQSGKQEMDFTVTNASGSSVRYAGTLETRSSVSLLPASPAPEKAP